MVVSTSAMIFVISIRSGSRPDSRTGLASGDIGHQRRSVSADRDRV
jgi:hypothetical protein